MNITLNLQDDGASAGTSPPRGRPRPSLAAPATATASSRVNQGEGPPLAGTVKDLGPTGFGFQAVGDGPNLPTLAFRR